MRKNTKKALSRLVIGILWVSMLGTPLAESSQAAYAAEVSGGDVSGNDSDNPGDAGDVSGNDISAGDVSEGDILPVSVAEEAVRVEMNGETTLFCGMEGCKGIHGKPETEDGGIPDNPSSGL